MARHRALDLLRRDTSLAHKVAELEDALERSVSSDSTAEPEMDDQLALILMCSHPQLAVECQIALTLKFACGFSTAEMARAFLTPEATIAQRLVRAKRQVIYLLFNEGYGATRGDDLVRADLCEEAIRLADLLIRHEGLRTPAVHALLALMMLQAARLPARTQVDGTLALLAQQDRSLWDQRLISLGLRHLGWSASGDALRFSLTGRDCGNSRNLCD